MLIDLAKHQAWADAEHWKTFHANSKLLEDAEIQKRLSHMVQGLGILQALARGGTADPAKMKEVLPPSELEAAMNKSNAELRTLLGSVDLDRMIALPRGPKGPFEVPAGVLLLQAITHSQHHRGQNAARIRELGGTPPMTDYIAWFAFGRP